MSEFFGSAPCAVILFLHGAPDSEMLKLAETAFRQADAVYSPVFKVGASNIRLNLAFVLQAEGQTKEAKEIIDSLNAQGMLIDPEMAILGDFRPPGLQR